MLGTCEVSRRASLGVCAGRVAVAIRFVSIGLTPAGGGAGADRLDVPREPFVLGPILP